MQIVKQAVKITRPDLFFFISGKCAGAMGMDMFSFSPRERRFYGFLVASSWLCNIAHGLTITILGPTQIYLARNVGVKIDTINLVWSFGFLGYMAGSFAAGMAYKE